MTDVLTVSYEKDEKWLDLSALCVVRKTDDTTTVVNMSTGDKANKIYQMLIGTHNEWIPVVFQTLTNEEKEYYKELFGTECTEKYNCPLPEDGQNVLISTKYGTIHLVTFENDGVYCGFEDYDANEVLAWCPLPELYKGGSK